MKKIKYIIVPLLSLLSLSCSEDWLNTNPLGKPTEVSFYETFNAVDMTATATYGNLCKDLTFDVDLICVLGGSPADDIETGGENNFDWTDAHALDLFQFDPSHAFIVRQWDYNYKGIKLANYTLSKLDIVEKGTNITAPEKKLIVTRRAEMKFMRAFHHFLIAQIFGGGPYVTELFTPDQFKSIKREPLASFYKKIEDDLLAAIPDLPTKDQNGAANVGRANKGAAQALLGKVYLYESSYAANYPGDKRFEGLQNHFAEALTQLEALINDDVNYGLVGINGESYNSWWNNGNKVGGYRWIFSLDGDNSKESVWEIQRQQDNLGYLDTRGSYLCVYTTARLLKTKTGPITGQFGWSFDSPSPYLEKAFGNNDDREDGLLSNSEKYSSKLDPRYPVTIGKDGDSLLYDDGKGAKWVLLDMSGGTIDNLPTHMICRKFECSPSEFWIPKGGSYAESPMNTRLIRMGDVYLMAAEAALLSGNNAKALKYINDVRKRARNSGLADGYPKFTDYPKDLASVKLEDIMHERRIELGGEGHRFFDVVRWNKTDLLNVDVVERKTQSKFTKEKNEFFPIPLNDIQTTWGSIVQNPGY